MYDKLISIIVPVYNAENTIGTCVDSFVRQSHKLLEIILVDDGSTDNSGKICDELAIKDNRIKVIHKDNEGISIEEIHLIETLDGRLKLSAALKSRMGGCISLKSFVTAAGHALGRQMRAAADTKTFISKEPVNYVFYEDRQ